MLHRWIFTFFLSGLISCHIMACSKNDTETIRTMFETTSGQTSFSLHVFPINDGLTNRNFKAVYNGIPFFVRLGHKDPQSLRIDRVKERSLYSIVEKDGIAPQLLYSNTKTGNLIAQFIQGTPYGKKNGTWLYERTESIQRIVTLLRCAHTHRSPSPTNIDYPFMIIDAYIQQARSASIPLPEDMDHTLSIVHNLKSALPQQEKVLCHQDLVPENFIFDGKGLYLVDWEYAEWSDPFYDLAALCVEHQFDDDEKNILINNYFDTPTEEQRIHLEMMCMLYSLRDCLWYFVENTLTPEKPCDFLELANYHYKNFYTSEQWLRAHNVTLSDKESA